MDSKTKICDEAYSPTESECIKAISDDVNNYYIIVGRGDIDVTHMMKKAAFDAFDRERKKPFSRLKYMTDNWFIRTQIQGWNPQPRKCIVPFSWIKF